MKKKKLIRLNFNKVVFERDNRACLFCGETEELDAHHITDRNEMPNGGYVLENGITLCTEHHVMAEVWHSSGHTKHEKNMHPDDLYAMIGSSYDLAVEKSSKLVLVE